MSRSPQNAPRASTSQLQSENGFSTAVVQGALEGITGCVLQAVRQNICQFPAGFDSVSTTTTTLSVQESTNVSVLRYAEQCDRANELPLMGIFTAIGFVIPVCVIVVVIYKWTSQFVHKHFVTSKYENLDGESASHDQPILEHGHLQAFQDLIRSRENESPVSKWLHDAANPLVPVGYYMNIAGLFAAVLSFIVYLSAVSVKMPSLELCGTMPNGQQIVDWFANLFLLFYLITRVYGRERTIRAMICGHAWVDYFTIPAALVVPFLDRYITGYGFLRSYSFLWLVEILAYKGSFKVHNTLKLTYLVFLVIIIWLISTGFLHLFENQGDFYPLVDRGVYNGQKVTYWTCLLYLYGKVSLNDLSGIQVQTILGKLTTYLFQLGALGTIGRIIPQIVTLIKRKPDYDQEYVLPDRFLHVVVAGHVTASAVGDFLGEFFHPDRPLSKNFQVAILGEQAPDEMMNQLMKKYFMRAEYKRGSVMNVKDMFRMKLNEAAAIILLADRPAPESKSADSINLMRVISVKNFNNKTRVIVQLIEFHHKAFLLKIPTWSVATGDMCICLAEFRYGLLAQSCRAPGASTLVSNFFTTRLYNHKQKYDNLWKIDYARGAALEMYARPLSDAFIGMSFSELCRFTYEKLNAVLVALKSNPYELITMPAVNPGPSFRVRQNAFGYFIADDAKSLFAMTHYCERCHKDCEDFSKIKQCGCKRTEPGFEGAFSEITSRQASKTKRVTAAEDEKIEEQVWNFISQNPTTPVSSEDGNEEINPSDGVGPTGGETRTLDSSGRFHWCPSRTMGSVLLTRQDATKRNFRQHVIVCILSRPDSPVLDLTCFALALRSSAIKTKDLLEIVVLCDQEFMEKEWQFFMNLPDVSIVKGDPLNRADLRAINLGTCRMCIILGAPSPAENSRIKDMDSSLMDKAVILATVNIRDIAHLKDHHDSPSDGHDEPHIERVYQYVEPGDQNRPRKRGAHLPLLTDLLHDLNVRYLDLDDEDKAETDFCSSEVFAGGRAFSGSLSDVLSVTAFYNPNVVNVLRTMIFGGTSAELERSLAEGAGLIGGKNISHHDADIQDQVLVCQYPLTHGPLAMHSNSSFGELFLDSLADGRLCLGIFRKIRLYDSAALPYKRVVITKPPPDFMLDPSDLIFCLDRPEGELAFGASGPDDDSRSGISDSWRGPVSVTGRRPNQSEFQRPLPRDTRATKKAEAKYADVTKKSAATPDQLDDSTTEITADSVAAQSGDSKTVSIGQRTAEEKPKTSNKIK